MVRAGVHVDTVLADVTELALERRDFRLAIIAFNSLLCIPDFDDQRMALMKAAAHLRPGGELLLALDAMPPVAFDLGLLGWTPTLELTAHIRARPAPGWLRVALSTDNLSGGFLEEDAVIWDSTDRLVAQSRQLCGVRMADAAPT